MKPPSVVLVALLAAWGIMGGLISIPILSPWNIQIYENALRAYVGISIATVCYTGGLLARELRKTNKRDLTD